MPRSTTRPAVANLSKKRAASREDGHARKRPHVESKSFSKPSKSKVVKHTAPETSEQKLPRRKKPVTVDENEAQSDDGASDEELDTNEDGVEEGAEVEEAMEVDGGENPSKSSTSFVVLTYLT